ncbi:hypothetical protein HK103_000290 [Boothiomyces macroporosus]|uniref:Sas10 C-terminal domain-containing protein n=1 Tax=Boothiomyces macroporosus TaxID=261099 RepID=A0AAD5UKM5_9FUNG|nr:hypothetical protein HK103_000268 [Boothiomyces macroporosus]KAJ3260680.1 hypothetical protein HK103_000290 [Boothiomyces macroporosus]
MARKRKSRKPAPPKEYTETKADLNNLDLNSEDEFQDQSEMITLDDRYQRDEESEQEVFGMDYDEDSVEEEELLEKFKAHNRHFLEPKSDDEEEHEEEDGWGQSRNDYYVSDEATDDEAKEEEQEALRLQKKQVETFEEQDFLDDNFENLIKNKLKSVERKEFNLDEAEVIQPNLSNLSVKEQMRLLKKNMPDILKYQKEFSVIWSELQNEGERDEVLFLKYLYLANLAYFLAMAASETNTRTTHPAIDHLKKFEALVSKSQQLVDEDQEESIEEDYELVEQEDISAQSSEEEEEQERAVEESEEESDAAIEEYQPYIPLKKKKKNASGLFGEGEDIAEVDLEDKIRQKKSLQFHVNRVDQNLLDKKLYSKINAKLQPKTEPAFDEEEDEQYLNETEKIYGKLSDNEIDQEEEGSDDYYEEVKSLKRKRREEREELHAELHKPMEEPAPEEDLDMDTKRKATYKILANRGLTPYRKKENRNPRVKKRMKYDAAKKKLTSVRRVAVDKSKLSKYQGELTGIKTNLSRSTKF